MNESFGLFIHKHRLMRKLSVKELAEKCNVSIEYLYKIESSQRSAPSLKVLIAFSHALLLSDNEEELMLDLAAKSKLASALAVDLVEYINEHPVIHKALRLSKNNNVSEDEWYLFINRIQENHS